MALIRQATMADLVTFAVLWGRGLRDAHEAGAEILPTVKTMNSYMEIFKNYVDGVVEGVALVAEEDGRAVGVLMWGSPGDAPFDTTHGKLAQAWGTMVALPHRRKGIATQLRDAASKTLADLGFETIIGGSVDTNLPGLDSALRKAGFKRWGTIGTKRLKES